MALGREDLSKGCPTDEAVALFLAGELPSEDERNFRAHVDECDMCRALLAEAGREPPALGMTRVAPLGVPRASAHLVPGDLIGEKYRIDAVLGSGGMGVVFRGTHLGLNRLVAIKMMHPELLTPDLARRFAREARSSASITSEHAVRIIDIDKLPSGAPYIVMEYLVGHDLHELLMRDGPLHWQRAIRYVTDAAAAIGEAHVRGIIHRDLKPHNLFLTTDDFIKVLDFGLAKLLPNSLVKGSSAETKSVGLVGSPQYMAPEQIRAVPTIGVATDVYALGATLYQLLAGVPPFLGLNLYVLCARILNDRPAPLERIRDDVPPAIAAVVMRCLEKSADARYPSIQALVEALHEASAGAAEGLNAGFDTLIRPLATTKPHPVDVGSGSVAIETLREQDVLTRRDDAPDTVLSASPATVQSPAVPPASSEAAPTPRMDDDAGSPATIKRPPRMPG
jgi:serine/threonine protein kinase